MSIQFVTPCCGKPLDIENLDELSVVFRQGVWWIKQQCCGDAYASGEDARKALKAFTVEVFRASVQAARQKFENKISDLRGEFEEEVRVFSGLHDPSLEEKYVAACWGDNGGDHVNNYNVEVFKTLEKTQVDIALKAQRLVRNGFTEVENDYENGEMLIVRKFVSGEKTRYAAAWVQKAREGCGYDESDN